MCPRPSPGLRAPPGPLPGTSDLSVRPARAALGSPPGLVAPQFQARVRTASQNLESGLRGRRGCRGTPTPGARRGREFLQPTQGSWPVWGLLFPSTWVDTPPPRGFSGISRDAVSLSQRMSGALRYAVCFGVCGVPAPPACAGSSVSSGVRQEASASACDDPCWEPAPRQLPGTHLPVSPLCEGAVPATCPSNPELAGPESHLVPVAGRVLPPSAASGSRAVGASRGGWVPCGWVMVWEGCWLAGPPEPLTPCWDRPWSPGAPAACHGPGPWATPTQSTVPASPAPPHRGLGHHPAGTQASPAQGEEMDVGPGSHPSLRAGPSARCRHLEAVLTLSFTRIRGVLSVDTMDANLDAFVLAHTPGAALSSERGAGRGTQHLLVLGAQHTTLSLGSLRPPQGQAWAPGRAAHQGHPLPPQRCAPAAGTQRPDAACFRLRAAALPRSGGFPAGSGWGGVRRGGREAMEGVPYKRPSSLQKASI